MDFNKLKELTEQIFLNTPEDISVGIGHKIQNGVNTGELSIIFLVEKKLPLSELNGDLILPTTIEIENEIFKTDVVEIGKFEPYQCNTQFLIDNGCYDWIRGSTPNPPFNTLATPNYSTLRPLVGGVSVKANNSYNIKGTLGLIAKDRTTGAFVGLSNAHTIIGDAFFTIDRTNIAQIEEESNIIQLQTGERPAFDPSLVIGETLRYQPLFKQPTLNYVDGALIAINSNILVGGQQLNLTANTVGIQFATTSEIDQLVTTFSGTEVISTSRTTGAKQGPCGLVVNAVGVAATITNWRSQGLVNFSVNFADCFTFTRTNPDCPYPVYPGDSGAVLIANFNGTYKIIGMVIGGNNATVGIACRIDRIAQSLDIIRWDGILTDTYFNNDDKEFITLPGGSNQISLVCDGKTYWQIGNTNVDNPC